MENLKVSGNTINDELNNLVNELSNIDGLDFINRTNVGFTKKTNKEKIVDRILTEIKEIESRDNLNLKYTTVKNKNGKYVKRVEGNRFYRNPNLLTNTVEFNIKYKGRTLRFGPKKMWKCKNDKNVLIDMLKSMLDIISGLDESHSFFQLIEKNVE